MAVGQNRMGTFLGLGKPPHYNLFKRLKLGVHRGTGVLTHSHFLNLPDWVDLGANHGALRTLIDLKAT